MKSRLKKKIRKLLTSVSGKQSYKCSICNSFIDAYLPLPDSYRENSVKMGYAHFGQNEHLNIDQYQCSNCLANDRDRFYASYYKDHLKLQKNTGKKLLHIAPSWALNERVLKKYFDVTTTDLFMDNVDVVADVENMKDFKMETFDYLICSHVLEHVNNPDMALKELLRVLKKGGSAIIMAPVIPGIPETLEDHNHTSKEDRIKYYGQEDHLRLFAKTDFIQRIKNAGFVLEQVDRKKMGKALFKSLGLRDTSILYIGHKN